MDLRGDRMALQRLKEAAERAKIELSSGFQTEVNLPFIAAGADGPRHLQMMFQRHELENLVEPLVQQTLEPCRRALTDAGVEPRDIDEVILVGGQTRMPRIRSWSRRCSARRRAGRQPGRGRRGRRRDPGRCAHRRGPGGPAARRDAALARHRDGWRRVHAADPA
jgi:molecular chaperone DnaK